MGADGCPDASRLVLVFDADGVLVEPWGFARELESDFGIPRRRTRQFFRTAFRRCLAGAADLRDVLPPYLQAWGWRGSVDEFLKTWLYRDDRPRPEVLALVTQLRHSGYTCCLASNQEIHRAAYMANAMGFASRFDGLYFSCHIGALKPAVDFYHAVQRDLGVPASRLWFWDDSPHHVHGARLCGWHAFLYRNPESITARLDELPAPRAS